MKQYIDTYIRTKNMVVNFLNYCDIKIKNRVNISKCSILKEKVDVVGDFEVDTVIGKNHKGALVTLVDRNSKLTLIKKVESRFAHSVTQAIIEMLRPIKDLVHTITPNEIFFNNLQRNLSA